MEVRATTLGNATKRLVRNRSLKSNLASACRNCIFFGGPLCGYTSSRDNNSAGRLAYDLIENKKHHPSLNTNFRKVINDGLPVPCDVAFRGELPAKTWLDTHRFLGASAICQVGALRTFDDRDTKERAANDDTFKEE